MKKKLIFVLIAISAIVLGLLLLFACQNKEEEKINLSDIGKSFIQSSKTQYVSQVVKGDVIKAVEVEGTIVGKDDNILDEYVINNYDKNNYALGKSGQKISKGDILYSHGNVTIKSKSNGRVVKMDIIDGNLLISVLNYDKLRIEAYVSQKQSDSIAYGQKVFVKYNNKEFIGKIDYIDYIINSGTGLMVRASYADKNRIAKPGSTVTLQIIQKIKKGVLSIERDALIHDSDGSYYVQKTEDTSLDSETENVGVKVGLIGTDKVEIESGLKEGDYVLAEFTKKDSKIDES